MEDKNVRTYQQSECVIFLHTKQRFGGLSNMCAGYPLRINEVDIRTAEALYQACRFPSYEVIQSEIIAQRSPISAKMKARKHHFFTRSDWNSVRLKVMRWTLRVKLAQNWDKFSTLLLLTGDKPIVEESSRGDKYWGAIRQQAGGTVLVGTNALGRLLMELRQELREKGETMKIVAPPVGLENFLFLGKAIALIEIH